MSKIIYHTGTGTYFDLSDGVVVIDTAALDASVEEIDDEIAEAIGQPFADVYTLVRWEDRLDEIVEKYYGGENPF